MEKQTGVDLIAEERKEQIEKHGFDAAHDAGKSNSYGELAEAAGHLIVDYLPIKGRNFCAYPESWDRKYLDKLESKNDVEKLIIAGALIAAEIDRSLSANKHCPRCFSIAGLKFPRGLDPYCEDCGWPDDDFSGDGH